MYSAVAQTHSELWGHVGACLLVVLDTAATARLFMSVKAEHTNISLKQPSSLHKDIKHLHVNLTGFGQFMYNLEVV